MPSAEAVTSDLPDLRNLAAAARTEVSQQTWSRVLAGCRVTQLLLSARPLHRQAAPPAEAVTLD